MAPTPTLLRGFAAACLLVSASGCATLTGSTTQVIEITTLDARGRPLRGVTCTLTHGPGSYVVDTPVVGLEIQRSSTDLEIECRRGSQLARATVVANAESAIAHTIIPGGSLATLVDHVTGAMYTYPSPLQLRIGQHLRFEVTPAARASVVADSDLPQAPAPRSTAAPAARARAAGTTTARQPTARQTTPRPAEPTATAATP